MNTRNHQLCKQQILKYEMNKHEGKNMETGQINTKSPSTSTFQTHKLVYSYRHIPTHTTAKFSVLVLF